MNSAKSLMTVGILSALALLAPGGSIAGAEQGAAPAKPAAPANRTDISKVDVEVKDFSFSARRPEGWREDAEAAKKYRVNLTFVPESEEAKANNAVIQVSADHKYDENISMVLDTQIANFRTRYPNLELGDLDVKHPSYATFPKLVSQTGDFYQYMAYVNPGTLYPYVFYVSLTTKKTAATPAEMAAYREVLESLQVNPPKGK